MSLFRGLSKICPTGFQIGGLHNLLSQLPINSPPVKSFTTTCSLGRRPGMIFTYCLSRQWAVKRRTDPNMYTVDAVHPIRTGGRGPDGKIKFKHVTTGLKRPWFMVDYNHSRHVSTGQTNEEIVLQVKKTFWRDPYIALVASGEIKRWVVATTNMKAGDIIHYHLDIPIIPVNARDGDVHPVGALSVGTIINQIEIRPGTGATRCRAAGMSATVIRRGKLVGQKSLEELNNLQSSEDLDDDHVVLVRENSNRKLMRLLPSCMVVVGQVSNNEHNQEKYRKFGEKYWRGIKQRSGLWQRKTGRFGRKIRPIGPAADFVQPEISKSAFILKCTLPSMSEFDRKKVRDLYHELNPGKLPSFQPTPKPYNEITPSVQNFRWCTWSSVR